MPDRSPMTLHVCPMKDVARVTANAGASHLISLTGASHMIETPRQLAPENHLRLAFNDIVEASDGLILPGEQHIVQLIAFARAWHDRHPDSRAPRHEDGSPPPGPLLIHCFAGISRSTAAAYILQCALRPQANEFRLAKNLRRQSPTATPNKLMVQLADHLLAREGRMISAISRIGRGAFTDFGAPFSLPL